MNALKLAFRVVIAALLGALAQAADVKLIGEETGHIPIASDRGPLTGELLARLYAVDEPPPFGHRRVAVFAIFDPSSGLYVTRGHDLAGNEDLHSAVRDYMRQEKIGIRARTMAGFSGESSRLWVNQSRKTVATSKEAADSVLPLLRGGVAALLKDKFATANHPVVLYKFFPSDFFDDPAYRDNAAPRIQMMTIMKVQPTKRGWHVEIRSWGPAADIELDTKLTVIRARKK